MVARRSGTAESRRMEFDGKKRLWRQWKITWKIAPGVNEGFEAWRQFVMECEPKLRTRYVGLLMNVLGCRFRDNIPTSWRRSRETVHDYENQSTKTVDDDVKIGVTMLGMEDMRVKEHLIRNSVRITSWNRSKRFSRSREHNSTSTVNRCQCS